MGEHRQRMIAKLEAMAKERGLSSRRVSNGEKWYIDLEKNRVVWAQVHELANGSDSVVLIIGKPDERFDCRDGVLKKVEGWEFDRLSGDFGQNKNWLRGLRPYDRYNEAKGFLIPAKPAKGNMDGRMFGKVGELLDYAAGR